MIIRLIRESVSAAASGPFHGQRILQNALGRYGPAWLKIGGALQADEIPWFWCWEDAQAACRWAAEGRPFILGPNVLFHNSRRPCQFLHERLLCNAASCRLLFTESAWYRDLIARQLGPANRAPIVLWPYPVVEAGSWELEAGSRGLEAGSSQEGDRVRSASASSPASSSQLPASNFDLPAPSFDLLIYAKSGYDGRLLEGLAARFPRCTVVRYGHYRREDLLRAAGGSRVCVYLSDDDRGPLALAEMLTCGCPAVGLPRGAPWIEHGINGATVNTFELDELTQAISLAMQLDRAAVAIAARREFSPKTVVRKIISALETWVFPPGSAGCHGSVAALRGGPV